MSSRSNVTIKNMEIKAFDHGIYLEDSSNNSIYGNNIANSVGSICLGFSSNNSISGNNIANNRDGIYLGYSSNNSISGNRFSKDGLFVQDSYGNVVVDNYVNGKPLVYLEDASDLVVEDAGQVILINCVNITVEGLNLSNIGVGIELLGTNNTKIAGNNIANNSCGIRLDSSSNNSISGNNIANNGHGIRLWEYSNNNSISGNNIANNRYGIELSSSSNNSIHHNNFIDNTQQVYISAAGYANAWDDGYPSGGNYWSDYTGEDLFSGPYQNQTGSDGIGDTPYVINEDNVDRYPLMNPTLIRDVAITAVTPAKTVVGTGYPVSVNVTVADQGDYTETFNVTLYAQNQTAINETGLVGYWNFDEGTGTTACDSSGNGNDGTIYGATWVNGRIGKALSFDGVDDYVEVLHSQSLQVVDAFTLTVWINVRDSSTWRGVISKTEANNPAPFDTYVVSGTNNMRFVIGDGSPYPQSITATGVVFNTWQHWAFIYNGTHIMIYRNGELVSGPTLVTAPVGDTGKPLKIGNRNDNLTPMNGTIDEVKIFNRALSADEVWAEYTRTVARFTIQTQTVTLPSGTSTTITFTWNTTGFAKGNYTISAYAWPVPGETYTVDNSYTDGVVYVSIAGDVNADGKVDMKDIGPICRAFGSYIGHPLYNPNYDITNDDKIDMKDIGIACRNFGKTDP